MFNRSFHFIPAHKKHLFIKLKDLSSDHYLFDLEDAVPENLKIESRDNLLDFFSKNSTKNCWIRINDINSKQFQDDLELIKKIEAIGVVIPKYQINESSYSELGNYRKILIIEDLKTLNGIANAKLPYNTFGLGLGLEDMLSIFTQKNDVIKPLIDDIKLQFVKSVKINDVKAIDGVFTNYKDTESFCCDCAESVSFGFDGKFSIYPTQIGIINNSYKIDENSIKWARKIVALCQSNSLPGYQIIDGVLITPPKLEKAKTILKSIGE